jgi:hypothetical protein
VLTVGLLCGLGGLIGGYVGARLQPRVPETGLRILLGILTVGLAITYVTHPTLRSTDQSCDERRTPTRQPITATSRASEA